MLFGHQDDTTQMPGGQVTAPATDTNATGLPATADDLSTAAPSNTSATSAPDFGSSAPTLDNPLSDESSSTATPSPEVTDAPEPSAPEPTASAAPTPVNDDLLSLKQQALDQLTPLVGHLEQSPEEKFRTTMMMIQSTDNQALLKEAYEAAQAISDDKARAQALLDVINEINYFSQKQA